MISAPVFTFDGLALAWVRLAIVAAILEATLKAVKIVLDAVIYSVIVDPVRAT